MQSIERFVVDQLTAWEVPGCAVAAVQDGQVVLAAGWGQRDLDTKLPVTADTLFAIGSTTKAFTAATVGALADDGLLDWERPLRDYVPEIQLHDPVVSDRLTVVDLLSHRSGLPRHEMAWLGHPGRSRAELVRRMRFLPLSKDLREAFQYCNLGYLAAGYAVEMLSGTPWEDYLRDRLLGPLGMGRSNLSVEEMSADPDHATAYERRQGDVVPVPQRPVTALAPAGAVNSCAADMARWLLAQLGAGQLDGRAVMSAGTVARQHEPHIVLPEDRTFPASTRHAYGLGWFIGRYRDHRLLEHGGGIDGFQTECMLLPDDGIGVAVMANTTFSAITPVVAYRVLDELLGLEPFDWFATFKPRFDAVMTGMREARAARRVVPDAPLPRPLDAYAGAVRAPRLRHAHHHRRRRRPAAAAGHPGPQPGPSPLRDVRPRMARARRPVPPVPADVPVRPGRRYHRPHRPLRAPARTAAVRPATRRVRAGPGGTPTALRDLRHGPDRGRGRPAR